MRRLARLALFVVCAVPSASGTEVLAQTEKGAPSVPAVQNPAKAAFDRSQPFETRLRAFEVLEDRGGSPQHMASLFGGKGDLLRGRGGAQAAQNLDLAIRAYDQGLDALGGPDANAYLWAGLHLSRASAYWKRARGDRAGNLEEALKSYGIALESLDQEAHATLWASTQINRALALLDRIDGDKATNLEAAIEGIGLALKVFTRSDHPWDWAHAHAQLAVAYRNRLEGDAAENIEKAIENYGRALDVFSAEGFREDWADAQTNRALAYAARRRGDPVENLEAAVEGHDLALGVISARKAPEDWAKAQMHRANALLDLALASSDAAALEAAIKGYDLALTVADRDLYPRLWAGSHMNRGNAYRRRLQGDPAKNLAEAVASYDHALDVFAPEAFPELNFDLLSNRTFAFAAGARWGEAEESAEQALATMNAMAREGVEAARTQRLLSEGGRVIHAAALLKARRGAFKEAVETLERHRDRLYALAFRIAETPQEQRDEIQDLRARLLALQDKGGLEALKGEALIPQIRALLSENQPWSLVARPPFHIAYPITSEIGGGVLLWTPDGRFFFKEAAGLQTSSEGILDDRGEWLRAHLALNAEYSEETRVRFQSAISTASEELGEIFGEVLEEMLQTAGTAPGSKVSIASQGELNLFPLWLAPVSQGGETLFEKYEITLWSSIRTHAPPQPAIRGEAASSHPEKLAAFHLDGASGPSWTRLERGLIQASWGGSYQAAASPQSSLGLLDEMGDAAFWHFSTHGRFGWAAARESGLQIGAAMELRSEDLFAHGLLSRFSPRLVTLSACEVGLSEEEDFSGQAQGIPAAFLRAGAQGVVAPIWAVSDLATSLLMAKFYEVMSEGSAPSQALRSAQIWLRSATREDLNEYLMSPVFLNTADEDFILKIDMALDYINYNVDDIYPFYNNYYWSSFVYIEGGGSYGFYNGFANL